MFTCIFCSKNFLQSYNLTRHQKTSKSCIIQQNIKQADSIEHVSFDCQFCKKKYTRKYHLDNHIKRCNDKVIYENSILSKKMDAVIELLKIVLILIVIYLNHLSTIQISVLSTIFLTLVNKTSKIFKSLISLLLKKKYFKSLMKPLLKVE